MLSMSELIKAGNPLLVARGIAQRRKEIKAKRSTISRWKVCFNERAIQRVKSEIAERQAYLETLEARQRQLPEILERLERDVQKLNRDIKSLQILYPRDEVGKLAKRLLEAGLDETLVAKIERLLNGEAS